MVRLSNQTRASFIYKNHAFSLCHPLTTKPAITAVIPREIPTHGIYANPAEWYKNPTKSPKKQAINELTPIINDININGIISRGVMGAGIYMYGIP